MTKLVYICNYLEENDFYPVSVRSYGPAATEKVRGICKALKSVDVEVDLISSRLGDFQDSSFFRPILVVNKDFGKVYYSPVINSRLLNRLLNPFFLSLTFLYYFAKNRRLGFKKILFYNRQPYYYLTILIARILGKNILFDIEDQYSINEPGGISYHFFRRVNEIYSDLMQTDNKVIVANTKIAAALSNDCLPCYGIADIVRSPIMYESTINLLFCGSLTVETGCKELEQAILKLDKVDGFSNKIQLNISGFGSYSHNFDLLSKKISWLNFLGNISREEYEDLLLQSHVGLVLKKPDTELGDTTFPSKTVEFVKNGLCIISYELDDVKTFLGSNALWVNYTNSLFQILHSLIRKDGNEIYQIAIGAQKNLLNHLGTEKVGAELKDFLGL